MAPPLIKGKSGEAQSLIGVAKLMLIAARTAPKTSGLDDVLSLIVYGREKNALAAEMEKIADERESEGFRRDALNVRDSEAIVLVGVRGTKSVGLNCGGCGFNDCRDFDEHKRTMGRDFVGPNCIFKLLDLGIALSSAAKIAGMLNVDNRIMYRVGVAAVRLKSLPEASVVKGIPLSAHGKNIYFDRGK